MFIRYLFQIGCKYTRIWLHYVSSLIILILLLLIFWLHFSKLFKVTLYISSVPAKVSLPYQILHGRHFFTVYVPFPFLSLIFFIFGIWLVAKLPNAYMDKDLDQIAETIIPWFSGIKTIDWIQGCSGGWLSVDYSLGIFYWGVSLAFCRLGGGNLPFYLPLCLFHFSMFFVILIFWLMLLLELVRLAPI